MKHYQHGSQLPLSGRLQALEHRFNTFQSKLDTTLQDFQRKIKAILNENMAALNDEIRADFDTRIDQIKLDIDRVWEARTDRLGTFCNELQAKLVDSCNEVADKLADRHHLQSGTLSMAESRCSKMITRMEEVIGQADETAKNLLNLIEDADMAAHNVRLQLERNVSCGEPVFHPGPAPDPEHPPSRGRAASPPSSPPARGRHYSPADEQVLTAQLKKTVSASRDASPAVRKAGMGQLRNNVERLEDCVRGTSPARPTRPGAQTAEWVQLALESQKILDELEAQHSR